MEPTRFPEAASPGRFLIHLARVDGPVPDRAETLPIGMMAFPAAASPRDTNQQFQELATKWHEETAHLSSTSVFSHPAYQQIIKLGWPVVPLLLADLARTKAHWFWALRAITGENPVHADDAGNVRKMIDAWRMWGESRGLI